LFSGDVGGLVAATTGVIDVNANEDVDVNTDVDVKTDVDDIGGDGDTAVERHDDACDACREPETPQRQTPTPTASTSILTTATLETSAPLPPSPSPLASTFPSAETADFERLRAEVSAATTALTARMAARDVDVDVAGAGANDPDFDRDSLYHPMNRR
jgi:hypothetical protein